MIRPGTKQQKTIGIALSYLAADILIRQRRLPDECHCLLVFHAGVNASVLQEILELNKKQIRLLVDKLCLIDNRRPRSIRHDPRGISGLLNLKTGKELIHGEKGDAERCSRRKRRRQSDKKKKPGLDPHHERTSIRTPSGSLFMALSAPDSPAKRRNAKTRITSRRTTETERITSG